MSRAFGPSASKTRREPCEKPVVGYALEVEGRREQQGLAAEFEREPRLLHRLVHGCSRHAGDNLARRDAVARHCAQHLMTAGNADRGALARRAEQGHGIAAMPEAPFRVVHHALEIDALVRGERGREARPKVRTFPPSPAVVVAVIGEISYSQVAVCLS